MVSHDSVENYYRTNFSLKTHHHYNIDELESMIVWEREAYVIMLIDYLEKENERLRMEQAANRG